MLITFLTNYVQISDADKMFRSVEKSMEEMKRLLLLLLGCAVQVSRVFAFSFHTYGK